MCLCVEIFNKMGLAAVWLNKFNPYISQTTKTTPAKYTEDKPFPHLLKQ